jgi:hypothetical protein
MVRRSSGFRALLGRGRSVVVRTSTCITGVSAQRCRLRSDSPIHCHLHLILPERKNKRPGWWQIVACGEERSEGFTWQLRIELIDALIEIGGSKYLSRRIWH